MIADLIKRLEEAPWGSRDMDADIWDAVPECQPVKGDSHFIPYFTTSLDAALTLVPRHPGGHLYCTRIELWSNGEGNAHITPPVGDDIHSRAQATPALALCIAALKARELTCALQPGDMGEEDK